MQGGTLNGSTITNLQSNAVIQLGSVAGAPGSFAKIDFQGLDIGAGNTLTIRSGAPGQTVYVVNAGGAVATIAGTLQAQAGGRRAGAVPLRAEPERTRRTATSGIVRGPAGLTVDTLAGSWTSGQPLVNQGSIDGAASLQLFAAKVNGGGAFRGNAIVLATFGNLNNPVNGAHFLSNGLQPPSRQRQRVRRHAGRVRRRAAVHEPDAARRRDDRHAVGVAERIGAAAQQPARDARARRVRPACRIPPTAAAA